MDHGEAVTKHYVYGLNSVEDGYWDDVFREVSYFENSSSPLDNDMVCKGNEVGEFDVLFLNYKDKNAFYKEVKTSYGDLAYAEEQLSRAEQFFEDTEWSVYGFSVLER